MFPVSEKLAHKAEKHPIRAEIALGAASLLTAAASGAGYVIGQRVLDALYDWDGARYAGSRLTGITGSNVFELLDQALDGLIRLVGYMEGRILLSMQGILSVGALGLIALSALLCMRALQSADDETTEMRFGVLALVMSGALTLFTFLFVDGLYLNRYWIPVMTLGAPVMAACLTKERNVMLRALAALTFACVVLGLSAAQIRNSMGAPEIGEGERLNAAAVRESEIDFGYATFWNANVMTELTDGEVEIVGMSLAANEEGEMYPSWVNWLETKENAGENRPQEPVMMLLDENEAAQLEAFLSLCSAEEKELPAPGLRMYVVESQKAYFDAVRVMKGEN